METIRRWLDATYYFHYQLIQPVEQRVYLAVEAAAELWKLLNTLGGASTDQRELIMREAVAIATTDDSDGNKQLCKRGVTALKAKWAQVRLQDGSPVSGGTETTGWQVLHGRTRAACTAFLVQVQWQLCRHPNYFLFEFSWLRRLLEVCLPKGTTLGSYTAAGDVGV